MGLFPKAFGKLIISFLKKNHVFRNFGKYEKIFALRAIKDSYPRSLLGKLNGFFNVF